MQIRHAGYQPALAGGLARAAAPGTHSIWPAKTAHFERWEGIANPYQSEPAVRAPRRQIARVRALGPLDVIQEFSC